jgi:hypothetical protein
LQALTSALKARVTKQCSPPPFDLGDSIARVVECRPSFGRRENELGATVMRIRSTLEVAKALQLIDQFGGRRETQLRIGREVGQADSVDADVAEDMQVRFADVSVAAVLGSREQVSPERGKQADEELTDG